MSNRDYQVTIEPFGVFPLNVTEPEFLFVRDCPVKIKGVINGQTTVLEKGDKRRFERGIVNDQSIKTIYLHNPTDQKINVHLVAGKGDFTKIVVTGLVTAISGLLTESGEEVDDTRATYDGRAQVVQSPINTDNTVYRYKSYSQIFGNKLIGPYQTVQPAVGERDSDGNDFYTVEFLDLAKTTDTQFKVRYPVLWGNYSGNKGNRPSSISLVNAGNKSDAILRTDGGSTTSRFLFHFSGSAFVYAGKVFDWFDAPSVTLSNMHWDRWNNRLIGGNGTGIYTIARTYDIANQVEIGPFYSDAGVKMTYVNAVLGKNTYLMYAPADSSTTYYIFKDGVHVDTVTAPVGNYHRWWMLPGKRAVGFEDSPTKRLAYFGFSDFYRQGYVQLLEGCSQLTRNDTGIVDVSDPYFISMLPNRKTVVNGPGIKLLIALLDGIDPDYVPENYLDYVYAVTWHDGERERSISTGSLSFARADIVDDITLGNIEKFSITLREGLL